MAARATTRRRALALATLAAAVGAAVLAPAALAGAILPESGGSPNADQISSLYELTLYIGAVVFVAVEVALLYAVVKFRYRRGAVAAQIRGNTQLEIGWTVAAALILVFLTVVTFLKLDSIIDPATPGADAKAGGAQLYAAVGSLPPPGGDQMRIGVTGQQYVWRFNYPNGAFSYDTMVVPTDTTVTLKIEAADVIHSWWIPKLGGKFDATPGYSNYTWFRIAKPGVYPGQCAELCGRNHANMLARVRAVPKDEYQRWLVTQEQDIESANRAAAAEQTAESRTNPANE